MEEEKKNDDINKFDISADGKTSLYIAAGRAIESKRGGKDRLFLDEYSDRFASYNDNAGYKFISLFADALTEMNINNNIVGGEVTANYLSMFVAFRTKWIDDSIYFALDYDKKRTRLISSMNTNINNKRNKIERIKQIIVLGVGCDTRCFRLAKLKGDTKIYHIDKSDVIKFRKEIIKNEFGICPYIDIECDLNDNKWIEKLIKSGYKTNKKSVWITEGILEYFNLNKFNEILSIIDKNTCNGSWLIGEIPNKINVSLKGTHDIWVKLGGARVLTGCDLPKNDILNKYGFTENQNVNILGVDESNYNNRSPKEYIKYQKMSKPVNGDKITRIQLYRGMKPYENDNDNDDNDIKTPL